MWHESALEIVKSLAEKERIYYDSFTGKKECYFCHTDYPNDITKHFADCVFARAKRFLKKRY